MSDLDNIQNELQSVLGYYELKMWDEALAEIDTLDARFGARLELNELRLVIYQGAQRWEPMRKLAQTCAEKEPTRASWFISWAFALRREESIKAAEKVLERAYALHPAEALVAFNLACYAAQLGELSKSRSLLARALELDPKLKKNSHEDPDLAPIREAGGLAHLTPPPAPTPVHVPGLSPTASPALRVYARTLVEGDAPGRAVALLALVAAKAESVLVALLGSSEPAVAQLAAQGLWECWLNEMGPPARARIEKGVAAMERADVEGAEKIFAKLIVEFPKWAEAINKMATLYYLGKRYKESLALCRRVVELKPDHFGAWQGIALCAVQMEQWPIALEAARQSLRLQPQHVPHQELVQTLEKKIAGERD